MIQPGLVSITFRQLSCDEIITLVKQAGLRAIEWGGDIHVQHGDTARASEVGDKTREAGLEIAAYGSYYRLGKSANEGLGFQKVLDSASALGSPVIRIWAGFKGSAESSADERKALSIEAREIAEAAGERKIKIAMEFHGGSLTDTTESALKFLEECASENIQTYWQPPLNLNHPECVKSLWAVLPHLSNLHVFSWGTKPDGTYSRLPFADHSKEWTEYLSIASRLPSDRYAMIEFVKDDSPAQFLADAAALKLILS
ncbi:MAG: hypothetical protein A2020_03075 [Lentisphaerae bacterium GWF2_45_14]|nr:MAG: hypothetical protein A2020_03075 [Lentisphaerae bacterium GWF2_45_14]